MYQTLKQKFLQIEKQKVCITQDKENDRDKFFRLLEEYKKYKSNFAKNIEFNATSYDMSMINNLTDIK